MWDRFGPMLKAKRQRAKLTQEALADALDMSRVYVAYLETNKRRPSLEVVEALAQALKCRVRDLLPE